MQSVIKVCLAHSSLKHRSLRSAATLSFNVYQRMRVDRPCCHRLCTMSVQTKDKTELLSPGNNDNSKALDIKAQYARLISLFTEINRFDWIDNGVALGTDNVSVKTLERNRISAVVSVGAKLKNNGLKLEKIYLEVKDGEPPSEEQVLNAVEWMQQKVSRGGRVFIHCHAGMGRSVTLAVCYLMHKGYRLDEALSLVRKRHPQSSPTNRQLAFLRKFSQRFSAKPGTDSSDHTQDPVRV